MGLPMPFSLIYFRMCNWERSSNSCQNYTNCWRNSGNSI